MAVGSGVEFTADFKEVRDAFEALKDTSAALNALDPLRGVKGYSPVGNRMNQLVRRETRQMADRVIVPALQSSASARGNTFDERIAATARGVNDRLPVVKVGKVQPQLSGWKYTKQTDRGRLRGTLAFGSEYGPKGGHRTGKHQGRDVNYYGKPRNESGYWIRPAILSAAVTRGIINGYRDVIDSAFRQFGITRRLGG